MALEAGTTVKRASQDTGNFTNTCIARIEILSWRIMERIRQAENVSLQSSLGFFFSFFRSFLSVKVSTCRSRFVVTLSTCMRVSCIAYAPTMYVLLLFATLDSAGWARC